MVPSLEVERHERAAERVSGRLLEDRLQLHVDREVHVAPCDRVDVAVVAEELPVHVFRLDLASDVDDLPVEPGRAAEDGLKPALEPRTANVVARVVPVVLPCLELVGPDLRHVPDQVRAELIEGVVATRVDDGVHPRKLRPTRLDLGELIAVDVTIDDDVARPASGDAATALAVFGAEVKQRAEQLNGFGIGRQHVRRGHDVVRRAVLGDQPALGVKHAPALWRELDLAHEVLVREPEVLLAVAHLEGVEPRGERDQRDREEYAEHAQAPVELSQARPGRRDAVDRIIHRTSHQLTGATCSVPSARASVARRRRAATRAGARVRPTRGSPEA